MQRVEIGRRIRQVRQERGLTQKELGGRLGFSAGWVSMVERGGIGLEVPELDRVAQALRVSIYELIADSARDELGELLRPFEDDLTERDKEELLQIARLKAELNRKAKQQGDRGEH